MADAKDQDQLETEERPKAEPEVEVPEEPETPEESESEEQELETSEGEEPEKRPSRRESLRIQALIEKLKQKDAAPLPSAVKADLDYKTALDTDEETASRLEQDRTKYGDARYNEGLEQVKSIQFHTRLEIDAPRVEAKYPVLDKNSPKFNPVVARALNDSYLSTVGFNPQTDRVKNSNIRYMDYIEAQMELAEEIAQERVTRSTRNIASQAAATGLRPTGGTSKRLNLNQEPSAMSNEELDAFLAKNVPTTKRK